MPAAPGAKARSISTPPLTFSRAPSTGCRIGAKGRRDPRRRRDLNAQRVASVVSKSCFRPLQFPVHRRKRMGNPHLPGCANWAYSKPLMTKAQPPTRHIISINDLTNKEIETVFEVAQGFLKELADDHVSYRIGRSTDIASKFILASLFYEPSTRTRLSFE